MSMRLTDSLSQWRDWGLTEEPQLLKVFTSGQNHHTGLIEVGEQQYVLKVFTHSFERAMAAERLANQQGVSPNIVYAANNIAVFEFIPSPPKPELTLGELAKTLSTVHDAKADSLGKFDLNGFYTVYLCTADTLTRAWHQALLPALNEFINDPTPRCFCHNDLVQENCLVSDRLYLIDWEFAQQHNPWFDLAAIVVYFKLNLEDATEFLGRYKSGWQEQVSERIFYTSQIALLWADLLWNMNKFGNDYRSKNPRRFERLQVIASKLDIDLAS